MFFDVFLDLFNEAIGGAFADVAAIGDRVNIDFFESIFFCHFEEGKKVIDLGVDTLVGNHTEEMEGVFIFLGFFKSADQDFILEKVANFDVVVDFFEGLEGDAARADGKMANFGAAHKVSG